MYKVTIVLNKYTDDLKDETEINVNNISAIVYQPNPK